MRLDLAELDHKKSFEFTGLIDRLVSILPGLEAHHCSLGKQGGFLERLHEGTYFGHIVEHVAIELTQLAGIGVNHGKTRFAGKPRHYNIAINYRSEEATRYLLKAAVELVETLVRSEPCLLEPLIEQASLIADENNLGITTRAIVTAAERRGIPWRREGDGSLVQLGYGKNLHYVQAAMTDQSSAIAIEVAEDKDLAKAVLRRAAIPVPDGEVVRSVAEAMRILKRLGPPVAVKPLTGRQGIGVSVDVMTRAEMCKAFDAATEFSSSVLIEEMLRGRNYRVLVVNGRAVAASERRPCEVVGDGVHTIEQLIENENENSLRGEGHEKPLSKIRIDLTVIAHLEKLALSMQDVPSEGLVIQLSSRNNLSAGATARDMTEKMHPTISRTCVRAARVVGMDICGVDIVVDDISKPFSTGGIIEVNAAPGLRMHLFPSEGKARDVAGAIVEMLYPGKTPSRIPIVAVTGTNGKTTVTRMIGHVFRHAGLHVGMTTTDGIYINGERIVSGDTTGPRSAQAVLCDPAIEAAVLETARGGIVRRGLGYDWSDIAVLTNISNDHVGQDGIRSVEDLIFIKSLLAERVREGGTLILNADDEHHARVLERAAVKRVHKTLVYFSLHPDNPVTTKHLAHGGTAFVRKGGWLVEIFKSGCSKIVELSTMPITMNGAAEFQAANLLAAFAACRAYGLSSDKISQSLTQFSSCTDNPGRANLYKLNGGHVMLDYGHNPDAFNAICRMAAKWKDRSITGIIAMPGDRDDSVIRHAGRVAAQGFDRVIVREDLDKRGRRPGRVAQILCETVRKECPGRSCEVVMDETEALRSAVERMDKGEIVVVFYEKLEAIRQLLKELSAEPALSIPRLSETTVVQS
jgi:cyanophycin synthetase